MKVVDEREEFLRKFREANKGDIVDFKVCEKPLDMALWVLFVAKEKLGQKRLTAFFGVKRPGFRRKPAGLSE